MKQCPACHSQYTDDTLQFCLQDGSLLQPVGSSQDKTLAFGEQETIASSRRSERINTPPVTNPTGWNANQYQTNAEIKTPERKSNATAAVFLTAFVMLILFAFAGIGAWLYFRGATPDDNGNLLLAKKTPDRETSNVAAPSDSSKMPTTASTPLANRASNVPTNPAPTVDKEQIKRDVSQRLTSWKSAAESLDLDNYMNSYAPTVDYYNKKGASAATVRADKQRAFTAYDSMKITLGNIAVTPDASGETATAVFDKEWLFEGAKRSAGKVQTQLRLKKINNQWLIAGERDLKVYYTE